MSQDIKMFLDKITATAQEALVKCCGEIDANEKERLRIRDECFSLVKESEDRIQKLLKIEFSHLLQILDEFLDENLRQNGKN